MKKALNKVYSFFAILVFIALLGGISYLTSQLETQKNTPCMDTSHEDIKTIEQFVNQGLTDWQEEWGNPPDRKLVINALCKLFAKSIQTETKKHLKLF